MAFEQDVGSAASSTLGCGTNGPMGILFSFREIKELVSMYKSMWVVSVCRKFMM